MQEATIMPWYIKDSVEENIYREAMEHNEQHLKIHKAFIITGFEHFVNNPEMVNYITNDLSVSLDYLKEKCLVHDDSKNSECEKVATALYWYYKTNDKEITKHIYSCYRYAYLNHIHVNDHHPEHWVLADDTRLFPKRLEMPTAAILEMILDWWSFSLEKKDPMEIYDFYEKTFDKELLHKSTRVLVEDILERMKPLAKSVDELIF